jgi:glycosyltransferase involved in cell wall biosynthesis
MLTADVTLITSKRESGPLVAREAIVCGCPVVGVDVGDLSQWLDEVQERDVGKIADAVERVLSKGQDITLPDRFLSERVRNAWTQLLESL